MGGGGGGEVSYSFQNMFHADLLLIGNWKDGTKNILLFLIFWVIFYFFLKYVFHACFMLSVSWNG